MTTTRMGTGVPNDTPLGAFLRDRRARLDPAACGFAAGRRRTPGLRREEVAQRANISTTWYTWLEQGRGGQPSADSLDRIARALALTPVEREHLYLLAQQRPPAVAHPAPADIPPQHLRLLDALDGIPAYIKTSLWDVVAWNRAARAVLADYGALPPDGRNILRIIFCNPASRTKMPDWEGTARFAVATFRAEAARSGAEIAGLVAELSGESADFARIWHDNDVQSHGAGNKLVNHPAVGTIGFEYASFTVDGQADLALVVYNPLTEDDRAKVRTLEAGLDAAST